MVEYETIGEPVTLSLSAGRFIELAKKAVVKEKEKITFFSIAQGEFYLDVDNNNAKRYTRSISIPVDKIDEVIEALKTIKEIP
ncbi:MAG: hypothetical protein KAT05_08865 [Spirochaetes bacterium]|nr:hypothetical protein [Spirochaetota bacterium]